MRWAQVIFSGGAFIARARGWFRRWLVRFSAGGALLFNARIRLHMWERWERGRAYGRAFLPNVLLRIRPFYFLLSAGLCGMLLSRVNSEESFPYGYCSFFYSDLRFRVCWIHTGSSWYYYEYIWLKFLGRWIDCKTKLSSVWLNFYSCSLYVSVPVIRTLLSSLIGLSRSRFQWATHNRLIIAWDFNWIDTIERGFWMEPRAYSDAKSFSITSNLIALLIYFRINIPYACGRNPMSHN